MNIHYPPDRILPKEKFERITNHITESSVEEYVQKAMALKGSSRIAIVGESGTKTAPKYNIKLI